MVKKYASDFPLPGGVEQYFETLLRLLRQVRDKRCLYARLAPRTLSDKLAQLSQTTSTDETHGGSG